MLSDSREGSKMTPQNWTLEGKNRILGRRGIKNNPPNWTSYIYVPLQRLLLRPTVRCYLASCHAVLKLIPNYRPSGSKQFENWIRTIQLQLNTVTKFTGNLLKCMKFKLVQLLNTVHLTKYYREMTLLAFPSRV